MQVSNALDTMAVREATFGDILIIDFEKDIPYTKIKDTKDFEALTITKDDRIYQKVEEIFKQPNRINVVSVFGSAEEDLKAELDTMYVKNKSFFFVLMSKFDEKKSKDVIDWAIAKGKIPVYLTEKDMTIEKMETFFKTLNNIGIAIATKNDNDFVDSKIIGLMATTTPGKDKFEWKEPSGAMQSGFTTTEEDKLEELGINTIQEEREGILGFFPGKCANGEFIDIVWGNANMQYDIETAFILAERKPYKIYHPGNDPRGVVQVEGIIQSIIDEYAGEDRDFIALDENGKAKAIIKVKTNYTEQDIKARKFQASWAAIPAGSASYGKIEGLLTFDKSKVEGA